MTDSDIRTLLDALNVAKIAETTSSGWVQASCPLAPFSSAHKSAVDAHPSFGIKVNDEGRSGYRCFTCNSHGTMQELMMRLHNYAASDQSEDYLQRLRDLAEWVRTVDREDVISPLVKKLRRGEYRDPSPLEVGGIKIPSKMVRALDADRPETIYSEADLDSYKELPQEALDYLTQQRSMPPAVIREWELRWHSPTRRIVIPIRDCQRRLVGFSTRALDPWVKPKFKHSKGFLRDRYLYGEQHLVAGVQTAVMVEGFFDAIYLRDQGFPAFAIMGTHLSNLQVEKIVRFCRSVTVLLDGDAAGIAASERVLHSLQNRLPVRSIPLPTGKDPDDLSPLDLAELLG